METAYLSPKTKLAGNIQAAMAEMLKDIVENRGGGYASDHEAWAELKEYLENLKQMHSDIEKVHKEMWSAVKDHNADAFCALAQEFSRSATLLATDWTVSAALAKIAVELTDNSPAAVIMEIKLRGLKFDVNICEKTIYNYINSGDVFFSITNKDLPQRGEHKREYKKVREAKRQAPGEGIEDRPPEIEERKEEGHWEMDTVKGKKNGRKCALMLSERAMRTELVLPMAACTMECVVEKLDQLERRWGDKFSRIFKTITVDNGSEFMDYEGMMTSKETGEQRTQVFYCHPYRSNERGTNENQNRMFRRFFPKGTDLDAVPDEDISAVQDWMNNYPRKLLGGKTAGMLFDEFVASLS